MTYCCVPGCKKRGGHLFPKCSKRKKQWEHAVRRKNWKPSGTSVVCPDHFLPSCYVTEGFYSGLALTRKKLKKDAVPTVFTWRAQPNDTAAARQSRLERRRCRPRPNTLSCLPEPNVAGSSKQLEDCDVIEIEVTSNQLNDEQACTNTQTNIGVPMASVGCQTACQAPSFSVGKFANNPKAMHFYTGLESYRKFAFVLTTLGEAAHNLNYYGSQVLNLSIEDQFFLTLIKLRLNKQNFELSLLFEISETTVSNIFVTWVSFMALQWGEINMWPSRFLVKYFMPQGFRNKFPSTRVIIDGTEFPINKPKDPNMQQVTFSQYKNKNTLKVLVGATPGGLISYCSPAYGGSASDRQIVERSNLVGMCSPGDSIMADRGFNVQDLFATRGVSINIPSFLKGKSQLPGLKVLHDRKIASKRVHIERIIGLTKTYKILKCELHSSFAHLGTEIFFVCATLCNFRSGIVSKNA